jgi:uncharacterized delta-60 repeat protein
MPVTNRLFTYSATSITGASQSGNLAISTTYIPGYTWWGGPDESTCYIIAHSDNVINKRTERNRGATISTNSVGFWKTATQSDDAFLSMFNGLFNQSYGSASVAAYWLNTNGYWTSYTPEIPLASKSFITGGFLSYNGSSSNGLVKLNIDGTVDNTFSVGTGFSQSVPGAGLILSYSSIVQDDGKVIVAGAFTSYNGVSRKNIIRLNTNGIIDDTFSVGTGFDGSLFKITKQSDGKVIAVGGYLSYNGVSSREIIRLNTDGTVDNTFSAGTGFSGSITYDVKIQTNGKMLVGGNHTSYNGTTSKSIIRLNTDGTVDNTFSAGTAFDNAIYTICLQSDGKILAGGIFTYYNSLYRSKIIRLNSDGTDDSTFNTGSGFNADVRNIKIQSDGKILVCGGFTAYNGTTRNRIIRLNTDGSVDNTFSIGTGFNSTTYDFKIQADGKIIAVGLFTSYNGTSCSGIIRLGVDGTIDNTFSFGSGLIGPDAPYATSII